MSHPTSHHDCLAACGEPEFGACGAGMASAPGLAVVDSNRPETAGANRPAGIAGSARGLHKQSIAAH